MTDLVKEIKQGGRDRGKQFIKISKLSLIQIGSLYKIRMLRDLSQL